MKITPVVEADTERLKTIARLALSDSVELERSDLKKLLASIESDVVGYVGRAAGVYLKAGVDPIHGYILVKEHWRLAHLFVHPQHQGQGIGRALLLSALDICRSQSNKSFVRVNSSLNAVEFYRKMGFVSCEPETPVPSFAAPLLYLF